MQEINENVKRLLRQNMEAAHLVYHHFMPTIYEAVWEFAKSLKREMELRLEPTWKIQNTIEDTPQNPSGSGLEVWSEAWPKKGNIWWVKWQYQKGDFEYGLLNPQRKGRDAIKSRLGETVGELKFRQHNEWWAFYKRMGIPNLENDMTALERLLDEHERSTWADQVVHELLEFVHACDSAFKARS